MVDDENSSKPKIDQISIKCNLQQNLGNPMFDRKPKNSSTPTKTLAIFLPQKTLQTRRFFSHSLSLSLSFAQDFVRRDQIQIRKPEKVTKISLELNSNFGGDMDLAKPGMTNASLLELRRFEATHNSFPQLQFRNSQPFSQFRNSTECIQFNSIELARSEFLGSSNSGIWAATATIFPGAKLTLTKVVSRGGAKEMKRRHVAVPRCTGTVKVTWRPVSAT